MTTIPSTSISVTDTGATTQTSAVGAASSTQSGEAIDISSLIVLLQKTNQELRDILQKRSVSQMQNSYEMAVKSVDQKKEVASKTKNATMLNSLVSGLAGPGLGVVSGLFSVRGKIPGVNKISGETGEGFISGKEIEKFNNRFQGFLSKSELPADSQLSLSEGKFKQQHYDDNLKIIDDSYQEYCSKFNKLDGQAQLQERKKFNQITSDYHQLVSDLEKKLPGVDKKKSWGDAFNTGAQIMQIATPLGSAAGEMASMGATQAASKLQIGADYINDSKNIYDKQSDVDSNAMRSYSQKMTETTRSLTDLYGAMLNATSWK